MENLGERERRRNGTSVFNEPYSSEAVERLKTMIRTYEQQEKSKYYAILVDNETVVEKNADSANFDDYRPFVSNYTRTVEIRMFLGTSPNCNRHIFHKSKESLQGATIAPTKKIDVEAEIAKALADQKKAFQLESLIKKLKKKDKQIKKLKLQITESKTGLESIENLAGKAVQIAGLFKNGQRALSGVQEEATPQQGVEIEAEELTQEEELFYKLVEEVGAEGLEQALRVMELLSKHPHLEEVLTNELKKAKNEN